MSISYPDPFALALAHALADAGAPVFAGRMDDEGNPDGPNDRRWSGWQKTATGRKAHSVINNWQPGEALCMVAGVAYDVIDVDPRNGGIESFNKMTKELGDDGPETYLRVQTPSGGQHLYIEPLRMGTLHGFLPGIDLQGGRPDGTSRGFVFIPPTERPSKWGNSRAIKPYKAVRNLRPFNGSGNVAPIKRLIGKYLDLKQSTSGSVDKRPSTVNELKYKVQAAEAGEQRMALLRYVHELERRGLQRDEIITLCMALHIQNFDAKRPWLEKDFAGLLHRKGAVIPDATAEEMAALDGGITPLRTGRVTTLVNVKDELLSWVWEQYLAVGEFTMADGEKGQGKTFSFYDVIARLSRGDPMPGQSEAIVPPCNSIIFTYEGMAAIKPRLLAAEADLSRVFVPVLDRPRKRGDRPDDAMEDPLALPYGAEEIGRMIKEAGASLAMFDPIADFLSAEVQTHNDASVRLALRPLGIQLAKTGCSGLGIRHMNKSKDSDARFRGTGSSAFQNRARVHLIVGELPEQTEDGERQFAIGMADANDTKRVGGALAYKIVDSDIALDDQGRKVGRAEWLGYVDVDVNTLSRGPSLDGELGIRGPIPVAQEHVCEVLEELFGESQGYAIKAEDAIAALKAAGASTSPTVLAKARKRLGIKTVRTREEGGKTAGWTWVMQ